MSIEEKIKYYSENLNIFEDTMDKYKYLLDQGKNSKKFPEEFRKDNFKVKGCQSQVWVVPVLKEKLLSFHTDSDAFLTKGMITILSDIYGNNTPEDIMGADFEIVKRFNLEIILTPGRTNGVYSMLKEIKKYAETFSKKNS
tara:strand:- start:21 stop:443 length:423 start_codon:yes stop_codon:yes gene_type:complete